MALLEMKYSVQETEQAKKSSILTPAFYEWAYYGVQSASLLPAWGSPARLYQLRRLWYEQTNTLVVGALVGLKNTIIQTPWEINGPKTRTPFFQAIFQNAGIQSSFTAFVSQLTQDYLTLDSGAIIEIIGRGSPDTPLRGRIEGLNALDGLRCYHTGDPDFPVYYQSHITNKLHKLHYTRVARWVDSPSPDPYFRGLGLSPMSRAATVAQVTMLLSQYQVNTLDDTPASGILGISGMVESYYHRAKDNYEAQKVAGKQSLLPGILELFSQDPVNKLALEYIKFSEMPTGESSESILRNQVNLLALAIGVDPQDIFPLASSAMGSATQSTVLAQKGKGKSYGLMLTELERLINTAILPKNMEFKWKSHDAEQDQQEAQTAQLWAGIATSLKSGGVINETAAQKLLANNVEAFGDLLLDEAGQVRLPDDDPKEGDESTVGDTTPIGTEAETQTGEKALGDTQTQFETAIGSLFAKAVSGQTKRDSFGIVARGMIATYGAKAYRDGLRDGGVDPANITDEDLAEISQLAAEQSIYVTNITTAIYEDGSVSPAEAEGKPQLWWNKSIIPFYQAGLASADRNGMYEFFLGATEQHCSDCSRLNGQRHRLRDWIKRNLMPQSSSLACGGWRCDCGLKKTNLPEAGSY